MFAANTETDSLSVAFMSATIEQIKDYAAKVKAAGFNLNEELTDENVMGMVIITQHTHRGGDGKNEPPPPVCLWVRKSVRRRLRN